MVKFYIRGETEEEAKAEASIIAEMLGMNQKNIEVARNGEVYLNTTPA